MFTALQSKANLSPAISNELNQLMLTICNTQVLLFINYNIFLCIYKFRLRLMNQE